MKFSTAFHKRLETVLIICALLGGTVVLSSCGELLMIAAMFGDETAVQDVLNFFSIPISPSARLRVQGIHQLREWSATAGCSGQFDDELHRLFFGNLSVVTVDPAAPAGPLFGLQRQTDCSLYASGIHSGRRQ